MMNIRAIHATVSSYEAVPAFFEYSKYEESYVVGPSAIKNWSKLPPRLQKSLKGPLSMAGGAKPNLPKNGSGRGNFQKRSWETEPKSLFQIVREL